jgi:hypothetical protein
MNSVQAQIGLLRGGLFVLRDCAVVDAAGAGRPMLRLRENSVIER